MLQQSGIEFRYSTLFSQRTECAPRTIDDDLGIRITNFENGRTLTEMDFGEVNFQVISIPAHNIRKDEWELIKIARKSYFRMWGSNGLEGIEQDTFDGIGDSPYKSTVHYIAKINFPDEGGDNNKIITMRKVSALHDDKQVFEEYGYPDDLTFWKVEKEDGDSPLVEEMRQFLKGKGIAIERDIAAFSRSGTWPDNVMRKPYRGVNLSAVAFGLIQISALEGDQHKAWVAQLCPEFPEKVWLVEKKDGTPVILDFVPSSDLLGMPRNNIHENLDSPEVVETRLWAPGYWIDNERGRAIVLDMLEKGDLTADDFGPAFDLLIQNAARDGNAAELTAILRKAHLLGKQVSEISSSAIIGYLKSEKESEGQTVFPPGVYTRLSDFFTTSRNYKYMTQVMLQNEGLKKRLLYEGGDHPYPSTVFTEDWRRSSMNLLREAKAKYMDMLKFDPEG